MGTPVTVDIKEFPKISNIRLKTFSLFDSYFIETFQLLLHRISAGNKKFYLKITEPSLSSLCIHRTKKSGPLKHSLTGKLVESEAYELYADTIKLSCLKKSVF